MTQKRNQHEHEVTGTNATGFGTARLTVPPGADPNLTKKIELLAWMIDDTVPSVPPTRHHLIEEVAEYDDAVDNTSKAEELVDLLWLTYWLGWHNEAGQRLYSTLTTLTLEGILSLGKIAVGKWMQPQHIRNRLKRISRIARRSQTITA